jgi:hypothetical protein
MITALVNSPRTRLPRRLARPQRIKPPVAHLFARPALAHPPSTLPSTAQSPTIPRTRTSHPPSTSTRPPAAHPRRPPTRRALTHLPRTLLICRAIIHQPRIRSAASHAQHTRRSLTPLRTHPPSMHLPPLPRSRLSNGALTLPRRTCCPYRALTFKLLPPRTRPPRLPPPPRNHAHKRLHRSRRGRPGSLMPREDTAAAIAYV